MQLREQLQRTLGNTYTLERELGGGGMSQVFVAEETSLGRKVVVKVLPPSLTGDVNIERFKREIQVAARLQHAHIVPVLTAGETHGLPYYTMPFVEGESLRARLVRGGAFSITEAVSVLRDVARALAYAHEHGVVHRDIKPDNVMLSGGSAVVTDFGIAKAISASRTDPGTAALTQVGTSLGTPAYMAPEQAAGDPATDQRADLYAFGCMAYEMLAGAPPFVEKSPQQLLAAHMAKPAEPIAARRPDVPPALATLIMRCLEKEPSQRPEWAGDVARVLDTVTSGGAHPAMPEVLLAGPGMMRRALLLYAAAFVIVAVLARAAIVAIGLPDWVFPGALIVMALGLPVILFTGYVHRVTRRALTMTPQHTPGGSPSRGAHGTLATMAMRASPHVSWRRTTLGGMWAVGTFIVLVGAFMLLRGLGIGPAGSLLAAGRFDAKEPILVTDFAVSNADTSLGRVLSDATKTVLAQSSVITLLAPEAVGAALARMARPRSSAIDLPLAREMAARNSIKAIVDGQITGLGPGAGFLVTLRLVTADSLRELASFRETADNAQGLIDVIDKLSRQLRGRVGESLRDIREAPRLAQVTTASFEALQKYTAAHRAETLEGDRNRALTLMREAVTIDSTFAEGWRRLGIMLSNGGRPRSQIDSALTQAYRFRHRVPESERLFIEASYFAGGPGRDRGKAVAVWEEMLRRGDTLRAGNNMGLRLVQRREFARAESVYRAAIQHGGAVDRVTIINPTTPLLFQQKFAAAESMFVRATERFPDLRALPRGRIDMLYMRGDTAAYRRAVDSVMTQGDSLDRAWARGRANALALLDGRLRESNRAHLGRTGFATLAGRERLNRLTSATDRSIRMLILNDAPGLVRDLDAVLASVSIDSIPEADRPYFPIASTYAEAGRPDRAREILARYDAEVKDTALRRSQSAARHGALADILLAENKPLEAITEFRGADRLPDGPASDCTICLSINLAFAFDRAGMTDSAIVHYERATSGYYPFRMVTWIDAIFLAPFTKRLGELYESKGDAVKAAESYRKFIALWTNADPELQPQVQDVRDRVRRLADLERGSR